MGAGTPETSRFKLAILFPEASFRNDIYLKKKKIRTEFSLFEYLKITKFGQELEMLVLRDINSGVGYVETFLLFNNIFNFYHFFKIFSFSKNSTFVHFSTVSFVKIGLIFIFELNS